MKKEKIYEGEVHNMDEMNLGRQDSRPSSREIQGASPVWKALSIVIAMLTVAYDLSPIDAVPDTIPVLGWLDDVGMTIMAVLNVYQQFARDQGSMLVKLAKYIKWMMVALILLAGVAVGGLITLIVHLVTQS